MRRSCHNCKKGDREIIFRCPSCCIAFCNRLGCRQKAKLYSLYNKYEQIVIRCVHCLIPGCCIANPCVLRRRRNCDSYVNHIEMTQDNMIVTTFVKIKK
jgi:hypothetical protein